MTQLAFCAALYEAGRRYLPAFMAGVRAAARGHDACLVAAVDDLADPEDALADLAGDIGLRLTRCKPGSTPAAVRRTLLEQAVFSGGEILIFTDMDDVLMANAPGNHLAALDGVDFSYGDMSLMDARGNDLRRRFFDRADVPWSVTSPRQILRRNFLGLGNTAIRADRLPTAALHVPDDIVAVDWWLFTTLLLAGRRGARTVAPVASYRLHGTVLLGAGTPATPEALLRACRVMLRHYRAFPAVPGMAARAAVVDERIAQIVGTPPGIVAGRLAGLRDAPGVWFEGLDDIELAAPAFGAHAI
jgi:hypothetical protein